MAQQLVVDAVDGTWEFLGLSWGAGVATFTQQGADVLAQLPGQPDELLTGRTLGPVLLPALSQRDASPSPAEITFGGVTRPEDFSGRNWRLLNTGGSGGEPFRAFYQYNPLGGPCIVQSITGAPTWRYPLTRSLVGSDWHLSIGSEIMDGTTATPDPLYQWDGTGAGGMLDGYAAWMNFSGEVWFVLGNMGTLGWSRPYYSSVDQKFHWTGGIGTAIIANYRYCPQVVVLHPTNNVLVCYLTADCQIRNWQLDYDPTTNTYSTGYGEVTTALYALAIGGLWLASNGSIGMTYTDLDGTAQVVYSNDNGVTWA